MNISKAQTQVKAISTLIQDGAQLPEGWDAQAVVHEDNLSYFAWNTHSREAIVVDPMQEDWEVLLALAREDFAGYRFVAVIDTHTHADHVSCAASLAEALGVPLIQHELSPSRRIHLRVSRDTLIPTEAAPLRFLVTPGHTAEGITPIWGPFLFGGDTILYGDTGRDDLPGGDAGAHWESLQKIKAIAEPGMLLLPGHDLEGGRVSSWSTQLLINPALTQSKEAFLADGGAWVGPSPKLLKESLYENFK